MAESQYYLVKPIEIDKIKETQATEDQILVGIPLEEGKASFWDVVITDSELEKDLDLALNFRKGRRSKWGFDFFHKGELICGAQFGKGVNDNYLQGSPQEMAELASVDPWDLMDLVFNFDIAKVEDFAKLLRFAIIPVTPENY